MKIQTSISRRNVGRVLLLAASALFLPISWAAPPRSAPAGPASVVGSQKLDPALRRLVRDQERRASLAGALPSPERAPLIRTEHLANGELAAAVFVRSADPGRTKADIDALGGYVRVGVGEIVVAVLPVAALEILADRPENLSLEASHFRKPLLDVSRSATKADLVQAGSGLPMAYKGAGVIVGVVDSGIDYRHADFSTASGTRLLSIWDISGVPDGSSTPNICSRSQIGAGTCAERDLNGHGTHVAGTAAGNGRAQSGFIGMAPEADIIAAKAARETTADASFADDDVVAACSYIFQQAQAAGKPAVINLSLGGLSGPLDGSSSYEKALENLEGTGKIIVAAGGNSGADLVHLSYPVVGSDYNSALETILLYANDGSEGDISFWYGGGSISVGFAARTSADQVNPVATTPAVAPGQSTGVQQLRDGSGTVLAEYSIDASTTSYPTNGAHDVEIRFVPHVAGVYSLYTFGSGTFDAWASNMRFGTQATTFWRAGDTAKTIGEPGTAAKLITVGAFTTKTQWTDVNGTPQQTTSSCGGSSHDVIGTIACFSSLGPTRDGRTKPDIAAPGHRIASALSSDAVANHDASDRVLGGKLLMESGTSQATPHITGIVALMLQAKPSLTRDAALQTLQSTATKDANTGSTPNNTWGGGKVNALAAVQAVAPVGNPDFSISATGTLFATAGSPASGSVTTTGTNGFNASVNLSASGLPAGATASFSPSSIPAPGSGTASLTISTSLSTPAGSYPVTVTGTGGGKTHTASVALSVSANTGGATVVKFLPIVIDVAGSGGSRFGSELALANRGTSTATVRLDYVAATALAASGSGSMTTSVGPRRQVVIPDAIAFLRTGGLPIPGGGSNQGGTLRVTFSGLSSSDAAFVGARTTTPSGTGRAGLSYPGVAPEELFTDSAWIYGLRQNGADRSNLALVNGGTGGPVTLRVKIWKADGTALFTLSPDVTLGPGQWTQMARVLEPTGLSAGYAEVDLIAGTDPFYAYGVFNDNVTNDGSFVAPQPNTYNFETQSVPVLVETPTFSSELVLTNYTDKTETVLLSYAESLTPGSGAGGTATESLAPFQQKIIPDAIQYLRSRGVAVGSKGSASFAGALNATFRIGSTLDGGFAGARTGAPAPTGGQYGLFYTALGISGAVTDQAWLFGLQENSSVRSNVAMVNVGDSGASITLKVEIYNGATGQLAGTTENYTLGPGAWSQKSGLLPRFGAQNGYARVVKVSGSGRFLAYGVVNDGATPSSGATNDGSYVAFANK